MTQPSTEQQTQTEQNQANQSLEDEQAAEAQAEAELAAGFSKVRGEPSTEGANDDQQATEKSAAELEAERKAAEEAERKAAEEAAWNSLPPVVRSKLESIDKMQGTMDKLAGHIGGMKRQLDQTIATAQTAAKEAGTKAPTDAQVQEALSDPEAWQQFEEDFPDFAKPIATELNAIRKSIGERSNAVDPDSLAEQIEKRVSSQIDAAEERAYVRLKHPDWKNTVKTEDFKSWLQAQPEDMQARAESDLADDAIALLDGFNEHRKAREEAQRQQQKRQSRLQGAVAPRGTPVPPVQGLSDEQALARGFNRVRKAAR